MGGTVLGTWELRDRIGRGGMAEVWLAEHTQRRTPAAIKLLRLSTHDPELSRAFRTEVAAIAGLDHPAVVALFDHGVVPPEMAEQLRLPMGAPYLVLEHVDGGALDQHKGRLRWRTVREILLQLLDALAHSHARGVVHRDVKPGNLLIDRHRRSVRLTDFGIAHLRKDSARRATGGTPAYMAPEQFVGDWHDEGPWTDLYALGCLAWALVSGKPPFPYKDWAPAYHAHTRKSLPALRPSRAIPRGFEDWLQHLLAKDPVARYRRAADAAWGLVQLPDPPADADAVPGLEEDYPTVTPAATTLSMPALPRKRTRGGRETWHAPVPPMPKSWERPSLDRNAPPPGLSLFGLRSVPLVDREVERTELWAQLASCRAERTPRVVVLRGTAGCGKSCLAEWLCERAHEVGAATPLTATHGAAPGPADGLVAMIARQLRSEGLEVDDLRQRARAVLPPDDPDVEGDATALAELLAPSAPGEATGVQVGTVNERHQLLVRVLEGLAVERPVLVWLDDVDRGFDAVEFTQFVLDHARELPALFVLTARITRTLPELDGLIGHSAVRCLDLQPLAVTDHDTMVRGLLDLEPSVRARVVRRTGGNPSFAVQLLRDWVDRGVLEHSDSGYRLRRDVLVELPQDLARVWVTRIDSFVEPRPRADLRALELAACLGDNIDEGEWNAVLLLAGVAPDPALVDDLVEAGLARRRGPGAWSFTNSMLREAIELSAIDYARAHTAHRACADMLQAQGADPERLGRHRLAAGDPVRAIGPLTEAARTRVASASFGEIEELCEAIESALSGAGVPQDDPRWGDLLLMRLQNRTVHSHLDSEQYGEALLADARMHGWPELELWALHSCAHDASQRGDWKLALAYVDAADAVTGGEIETRLRLAFQRAQTLHAIGRNHEAIPVLQGTIGRAAGEGLIDVIADCNRVLAACLIGAGRLDEAQLHVDLALELAREAGIAHAARDGAHHRGRARAQPRGPRPRRAGLPCRGVPRARARLTAHCLRRDQPRPRAHRPRQVQRRRGAARERRSERPRSRAAGDRRGARARRVRSGPGRVEGRRSVLGGGRAGARRPPPDRSGLRRSVRALRPARRRRRHARACRGGVEARRAAVGGARQRGPRRVGTQPHARPGVSKCQAACSAASEPGSNGLLAEVSMRWSVALVLSVSVLASCGDKKPPVATAAAEAPADLAKRVDVVDTLHGTEVADPYRWLENADDPEVQAWVDQRNGAFDGYTGGLEQRQWLYDRFQYLWRYDDESTPSPCLLSDRVIYRTKQAEQDKWVVHMKDGETDKVLLDPNEWEPTETLAGFTPSPDCRYAVFGKAKAGDENPQLAVLDLDTLEVGADTFQGWRQRGVTWKHDNSGFFYSAWPLEGEVPEGEHHYWHRVWWHDLGSSKDDDQLFFEDKDIKEHFHGVGIDETGRWLVKYRSKFDKTEIWLRDLQDQEAEDVAIATGMDASYGVDVVDGKLLITTDKDAPNYKVYVTDVDKPAREHWTEWLPEGEDVLSYVSPVAGKVYAVYEHNATTRIAVHELDGTHLHDVELPTLGSAWVWGYWSKEQTWLSFSSYAFPSTVYTYDAGANALTMYKRSPVPLDPEGIVVDQVWYESKDGTEVSMFVVHHEDAPKDGSVPFLLTGYGGFNISMTPGFSTSLATWVQAGGGVAIPNLRGGGEYGQDWHEAGMRENKQNVFDDFIAAAEYLESSGWSHRDRIAIRGGSNGGLLVSAAVTQRPELFQAVLCQVPLTDMVRYHHFGLANIWAEEYGNADDPAMFEVLNAYSPYHRVTEGTDYPAILVTGSVNDARTDPVHARKFRGGRALRRHRQGERGAHPAAHPGRLGPRRCRDRRPEGPTRLRATTPS